MKSTRPDKHFSLEHTEGDGNCAFNAFILGLVNQQVLDAIEKEFIRRKKNIDDELVDFIMHASEALSLGGNYSWAILKQKMLELRLGDKVTLQKQLAPIMRKISLELARSSQAHFEQTMEPLLGAYHNYVAVHVEKKAEAQVKDDIFSRHPFIQEKFQKYAQEESGDVLLRSWWESDGYQQFNQDMANDGQWAGDLELAPLADYFHVNLDVVRNDFTHHIYFDAGVIPIEFNDVTLAEDHIQELVSRGVVDRPQPHDDTLMLLPLTSEEVDARLSAVPNHGDVSEYISETIGLKGSPVPEIWSSKLKYELTQRGVIGRLDSAHVVRQVFSLDQSDASTRVSEFGFKEEVVAVIAENRTASPTITLTNPRGVHWSNMQLQDELAHESEKNTCFYYAG